MHCVSLKQETVALVLLRTFTEQLSNVDDKAYIVLNLIVNTINNSMWSQTLSQSKIINYPLESCNNVYMFYYIFLVIIIYVYNHRHDKTFLLDLATF